MLSGYTAIFSIEISPAFIILKGELLGRRGRRRRG